MRKKRIIVAIILLILGASALMFSIFAKSSYFDITELSDDFIGQTISIEMTLDQQEIDSQNYLLYYEYGDNESVMLRIIVPENLSIQYARQMTSDIPITGTIRSCSPAMLEESYQIMEAYYKQFEGQIEGFQFDDELKAAIRENISPYALEVTSLEDNPISNWKQIAFLAGCVLLFAALIVLIAAFSGKIALIIFLVFLILTATAGILLRKKIQTVCSIRDEGNGLYYMEFSDDYKLDDMLKANITSDSEMANWLKKSVLCHLPFHISAEPYGCSSFKAKTEDGTILFGRSFDYSETDTLIIYSHPKNGYASYSVADLNEVGISKEKGDTDPDSLIGRIFMLAAPYVACDGINEAGLGISTLQVDIGELHEDHGKPDLFVFTAQRLVLDRCANVDEAVQLLETFDVHSHNNCRQHLFIVDKSGRSVVVEWIDDQMNVIETDACTNSVLTLGESYDIGADARLPQIQACLTEHNGILSSEQARDLLAQVALGTEWSCVYDLNNFKVDLYMDSDFDHVYQYSISN